MEYTKLINDRYSCKKYASTPVEKEKLDAILAAGRIAPTAKNLQEQHIYVLTSPEALAKVDATSPCRYGAPVVLAVAYNKDDVYTYPGGLHSSGIEDATIVATHMLLAAENEGLNTCWLNCFDPEALAKELGLPENEEISMLLDVGYHAADCTTSPNHGVRKDINETVTYM